MQRVEVRVNIIKLSNVSLKEYLSSLIIVKWNGWLAFKSMVKSQV